MHRIKLSTAIGVKCNDKISLHYANPHANIGAAQMLKAVKSASFILFVLLIGEYVPEENWDFLLDTVLFYY